MQSETRIDQIRKSLASAEKSKQTSTYTVRPWRNGELVCDIMTLPASYLKYRIENSRTNIQQMAYLRDNPDAEKDLFSDPEAMQAQAAQEHILTEMVKGKTDFLSDLKDRKQVEPAIITYDGFIVNGNRRTAALKLIGEDLIKCVVLPEDTTKRDIYDLEQELQIAQDFKEPYHWINELINIQYGLTDLEKTTVQIAKQLHQTDGDVKSKSRMLDLIDSFLIWKSIPKQRDYHKLDETEQIFIELEKALRSQQFKKDASKQTDLQYAVFTLIENKPSEGRLYQHVRDLIKRFNKIREKMSGSSKEGNDTAIHTPDSEDPNRDTDASILDEIGGEYSSGDIRLRGFDSPGDASFNASDLVDTIGDVKAAEREEDDLESVHNSVKKALRELQGLKVSADSKKLDSARNKLNEIKLKSDELLGQIEKVLGEQKN